VRRKTLKSIQITKARSCRVQVSSATIRCGSCTIFEVPALLRCEGSDDFLETQVAAQRILPAHRETTSRRGVRGRELQPRAAPRYWTGWK
jgi:hypothetical protein